MKGKNKKTALFGGSFNPIHWGHLFLAEYAAELLNIDRVIFMPSSVSPLKVKDPEQRQISADLKKDIVKAAIAGNPRFLLDTYELDKGGISYTIDTVKYLKRRYPDDELYLFIGEDNAAIFSQWKDNREILDLTEVVVLKRRGENAGNSSDFRILSTPLIDISSSEIRRRIKEGMSVKYYLPDAVLEILEKERVYG